jgi:transcriptional regulator GlxA family with amidase domain
MLPSRAVAFGRQIKLRYNDHREAARVLDLGSKSRFLATLQRRLQDSGSSFQRVLDEARHQMARYYLSNSALELNEKAYSLGFEDPSSFGRAFRNWEGMPPSDWRETHRSTKGCDQSSRF